MLSPEDLPLPPPPKGIEPMTVHQMGELIAQNFMASFDLDEGVARVRALAATTTLLEQGYVTAWGVDEHGEPLFIPSHPRIYLVVEGG